MLRSCCRSGAPREFLPSRRYCATRVDNFVIRAAETWTPGNIAGGVVLLLVVLVLIAWAVRVTLRG